jgi:hypothetical protein
MAIWQFGWRDPDLFRIFERRQIEPLPEIQQHVADAFSTTLNGSEIKRDLQIVALRNNGDKAGSDGRDKRCNHAGSSYPIADSISIVCRTAGRAIIRA